MDSRNEHDKQPDAINGETSPADSNPSHAAAPASSTGPQQLKHSGIGIASFTLGIVAIIMSIALTIYLFVGLASFLAGQDLATDPEILEQELLSMVEQNPMMLAAFPLFLVAGVMHLIGAVLGLIGLFQDDRKKFFAGFGLGLNALPIVGFIFLLLIGITMQ